MKVFSQKQVERIGELETSAAVLTEVLAINTALSDLQARVSRVAEMLATTKVILPQASNLSDILAVIDREMTAPVNSASEETSCPQREPTASGAGGFRPQADAGEEQRNTMGVTAGETAPYPPKSPTYEKVLDAYAASTGSAREIGHKVGILGSTVRAYLSMGRKVADRRVLDGDAARQKETPTEQDHDDEHDLVETVVVVVEDPMPPAKAPAAAPVISRSGTFKPPRMIDDEPEGPPRLRIPSVPPATRTPAAAPVEEVRPSPVADFDPGKIIVADVSGPRVYGPLGDIAVSRPFAQTVDRMADGGVYDAITLRDAGAWPTAEGMRTHFTFMAPKLKAIGVELVIVSKELFKLRRLEA